MGLIYFFWFFSIIFFIVFYKFGESFEGFFIVVINDLLVIFREEFESREVLNFDLFYFIGCGVYFGNDKVIFVFEFFC